MKFVFQLCCIGGPIAETRSAAAVDLDADFFRCLFFLHGR